MCCVCFLAPDREIRNALGRNPNIMPGMRASYPIKWLFSASSQHSFQFTSEQQVHLLPVPVLSDKHTWVSLCHLSWESPFPGAFQCKMPVIGV